MKAQILNSEAVAPSTNKVGKEKKRRRGRQEERHLMVGLRTEQKKHDVDYIVLKKKKTLYGKSGSFVSTRAVEGFSSKMKEKFKKKIKKQVCNDV